MTMNTSIEASTESTSFWFESTNEALRVFVAGTCFFSILFSYYLIRPIREQFASAMGGSSALPYLYTLVLSVMLVFTPIYGALVARYSRRIFVPVLYLGFVFCFFVIKWFVGLGYSVSVNGSIVYVYLSVFNLFVVSLFWSCMTDCFSQGEAKRFFGYVAGAGSIGAYLAPRGLRWIIGNYGSDVAYWVAGGLMLLALASLMLMFQFSRNLNGPSLSELAKNDEAIGGTWLSGAKACFESPFLRVMVLLLLCGDAVATILYANLSDYARETFKTADEAKIFFTRVDEYTNLTVMFLQFIVAGALLRWLGAGKTMAVPLAVGACLLFGIAITEATNLIILAMVVSRGGTYGLVTPARESLFSRVDRETRFKAKNFLDTAIWRFGDLVMVSFVAVLVKLGADITVFATVCGCAASFAVYLALKSERLLAQSTAASEGEG
jgi:ATP:ADP antiporter, AAA family